MDFYVNAFTQVMAFGPLTAMLGATLLGVFIGALPGLNPVMAIALLLPLTYSMDPLVALAMVAGIYNGSMYGGAIPAILLRIPGTPASIATTFDGFPMADRGEASKALKIACWSSAIGGIASAIALMTMGPILARLTLFFGPAEYFWIAIFGMASVGVMVGSDPIKGIMAAVLGLLIGTMGIDNLSGQARFTFGQTWLLGGLDLIVVLVGLYALPPVLQLAEKRDLMGLSAAQLKLADAPFAKGELRGLFPTWLRASGIGVGILPGAGGNIAAFLSYNAVKNASDDPDSFGKGNPQGVLLVPAILILMCVGVYVINGRMVDLWVMLGAGLTGYFLEKVNVPLAPIILGMILGPMAEQSIRRALLISRGDPTELFTRPLSAVLAVLTLLIVIWPLIRVLRRRRSTDIPPTT
ncbi:C4-dicarboxylate ABC transporter permease [Thalassococcus profundi]|uniref:C4-dicarboxylate ABC transporter permease n=1 Tax=Thalassococcus profundi TaxID=2282382 RepID=A0A369TKT4_9RHOB|nr:tripartite tricarboxylate transporter permease [Thalassococcus profundi]RDD64727.1 C4-dicarboxylate ABC transporter permease [Thalassococcus profundi]